MKVKIHQKSPLKAIRVKCLNCCGWSRKEVELCTAEDCPLYHFRDGKNPYRKASSVETD